MQPRVISYEMVMLSLILSTSAGSSSSSGHPFWSRAVWLKRSVIPRRTNQASRYGPKPQLAILKPRRMLLSLPPRTKRLIAPIWIVQGGFSCIDTAMTRATPTLFTVGDHQSSIIDHPLPSYDYISRNFQVISLTRVRVFARQFQSLYLSSSYGAPGMRRGPNVSVLQQSHASGKCSKYPFNIQ